MAQSSRSLTLILLALALAAGGLLSAAAYAPAKDSLAPRAAGDRWLPCERWVMYHWNPIDMQKLMDNTGVSERKLFLWLQDDDNRDLAGIIKSRKLDPKTVVGNSLAIEPGTSKRIRSILRARAERLLTQGHLAQHVFFHWFHSPAIRENAREIFGMQPWDYFRARRAGFSPADVGRLKRGYTRKQTAARVVKVLERYVRRGMKGGATSKAQADYYVAGITRLADVWLDQRYHKKRPTGGLPAPLGHAPKGPRTGSCRNFVGTSQQQDGFGHGMAKAGARAAGRLGYCPLESATLDVVSRRG
jgi:hypothetical protein